MNNQSVILSKDITSGDITPLISAGNVLLTSRPSLNQLTNVAITDPTDNQVLTYDAGGEFWYNADSQGGGGGGGGDNDFLSYSINFLTPTSLFIPNNAFFQLLNTVNYTEAPIINFNDSNNLTLTDGIITGLSPTKYYQVDINYTKNVATTSTGQNIMGLYNGSIETGTLIKSQTFNAGASNFNVLRLNTIITGVSNINPVFRFVGSAYTGSTNPLSNLINVVVKETTSGGGGATTLTELTDVNITTPANGQYLQYDTSLTPPKWVNKTPSYLSYSINAYPLNSKFTAQTYFSIFATSTFNTSPAPVYNYNFSNGISLSTATGLITGLDATKTYQIELSMMKNNSTGSNGVHTTSLFTDAPDAIPAGTAIVLNQAWNSSNFVMNINLNTILTGQTQICPVLQFGSATYTGIDRTYAFNATINIREL
jgi:hypothetical protein